MRSYKPYCNIINTKWPPHLHDRRLRVSHDIFDRTSEYCKKLAKVEKKQKIFKQIIVENKRTGLYQRRTEIKGKTEDDVTGTLSKLQ